MLSSFLSVCDGAADLARTLAELWRAQTADERARVAAYCEGVADSLWRLQEAWEMATADGSTGEDRRRAAIIRMREAGRIAAYIDHLAKVLADHLRADLIARLRSQLDECLAGATLDGPPTLEGPPPWRPPSGASRKAVLRLAQSEGYFRGLVDRLRA